jgi:hypothetical protein
MNYIPEGDLSLVDLVVAMVLAAVLVGLARRWVR